MTEAGGSISGTRRLLRRLRDIMAGSGTPQERLDRIVRIVAAEMVAEVCSAYVMRAGEVLELFATEGLRPEAVHRTRLRIGEGLVGVIAATARPLALADAQSHPDFAYRPETGEEIYHSLMGVPILRGGRVLGVLVVQNRSLRHYTEDEIEVLQTIAMVVAELAATGELVNPLEIAQSQGGGLLPLRLVGIRLNPGLAIAPAVLHEPRLLIRQLVAEDVEGELKRLRHGVTAMRTAIDELIVTGRGLGTGEHRDVLETYRMFAADRGWVARISDAIRSGLTAEFILVARAMGPAELMDYAHRRIVGLVLEEGSPTAHVAIVARALDIPVVGRVEDAASRIEVGDIVIVDGDHAQVMVRPSEDIHQSVAATVEAQARRRAIYDSLRSAASVTRDGIQIELLLNAGLLIDLPQLRATGAEGIGLFRTEIPFMVRDSFPDVEDQTEFYRSVFEQAGGSTVVFRTLDIGGDKVLPYLAHAVEDNPAMGWRAIRIGLDRPAMLRQQLRALIRAAETRPLFVKFPMIAEIAELERARTILDMELARAAKEGRALPAVIKTGVMLEVPALLWQLPALCERIDFLSIGTNDLVQFLFACDRGNPRLADRYDPLSMPMLALFREVVARTRDAGVPLSMCGEMAGNPIEAMTLIALGFRTLSMAAPAIGPVKMMIRSLDTAAVAAFLDEIACRPDHSLRPRLEAYARDHNIAL
jgi:phosphotransferase system, enzyme I, PtsP